MEFDFVSASAGFLVGAFTGAAGTYYGYLFTDRRREQEASRAERKTFKKIEQQMLELIAAFREDVKSHPLIREFFVSPNRKVCMGSSIPRLVYYEDEHADLRSKIAILENYDYVIDVTPGNAPMYRMTEQFISYLIRRD